MNSSNTATSVGVDSVHSYLTILQQTYTITLYSLSIATRYYYQVLAANSIDTVATNVLVFNAAEARECVVDNIND